MLFFFIDFSWFEYPVVCVCHTFMQRIATNNIITRFSNNVQTPQCQVLLIIVPALPLGTDLDPCWLKYHPRAEAALHNSKGWYFIMAGLISYKSLQCYSLRDSYISGRFRPPVLIKNQWLVHFDKIQSHRVKQSDPWAAPPRRVGTQCSEMCEEVAEWTRALSDGCLRLSYHWSVVRIWISEVRGSASPSVAVRRSAAGKIHCAPRNKSCFFLFFFSVTVTCLGWNKTVRISFTIYKQLVLKMSPTDQSSELALTW